MTHLGPDPNAVNYRADGTQFSKAVQNSGFSRFLTKTPSSAPLLFEVEMVRLLVEPELAAEEEHGTQVGLVDGRDELAAVR